MTNSSDNLRADVAELWHLLTAREKWSVRGLVVGMFFLSFLDVVGIGLFVPIVQVTTSSAGDYWLIADLEKRFGQRPLILILVGCLLGVVLIKNVLTITFSRVQYKVQYRLNERIGTELVASYLHRSYLFHVSETSPLLIRNVNSALSIVSSAIGPLMTIYNELLVVGSILIVLMLTSPIATIVATGVFLAVGLGYVWATRDVLNRLSERRERARGLNLKVLQETFSGIREIKVFGREQYAVEQIRGALSEETSLNVSFATLNAVPRLVLELAGVAGIFLMITYMIISGEPVSEISTTLIVFGVGLVRTLPSASKILGALHVLRFFAHSLNDVVTGLRGPAVVPQDQLAQPPTSTLVEFRRVGFRYPDAPTHTLEDVSLRLSPGQMIGLVGESGGGKSTLVDLVLGLIDPTEGSIEVGGVKLSECRTWWTAQIGYVPQSVFLTDSSIRSNVVFGPEELFDAEVLNYAYGRSKLTSFISTLSEGDLMKVGERGTRLSGGQVQRIGIARALYRRPCVLILDEPTSSLDEGTEREIMAEVAELKQQMTIIVVSHRPAALESCDVVFRVGDQRVEEVRRSDRV